MTFLQKVPRARTMEKAGAPPLRHRPSFSAATAKACQTRLCRLLNFHLRLTTCLPCDAFSVESLVPQAWHVPSAQRKIGYK